MNEEVNLWDEIMDDELYKKIHNVGFQKGKLEQKKEEFGDFVKWLDWLINSPKNTWSKQIKTKLEQLQKEINSQTEQNSDKEVAQPYSKSDTTTKEIGSNSK